MRISRFVTVGIAFVAMITLAAWADAAVPKIEWSSGNVGAKIVVGGTYTTTVTFKSSIDLKGVKLAWTPSVNGILKVDPTTFGDIAANTVTTVTLTVTIPSDAKRQTYNGAMWVVAGTAKQPQLRKFARPLNLRFQVTK
ncbi:MAG: hypothetical protein AB1714_01670 [Acidobacteriota bacterium]